MNPTEGFDNHKNFSLNLVKDKMIKTARNHIILHPILSKCSYMTQSSSLNLLVGDLVLRHFIGLYGLLKFNIDI